MDKFEGALFKSTQSKIENLDLRDSTEYIFQQFNREHIPVGIILGKNSFNEAQNNAKVVPVLFEGNTMRLSDEILDSKEFDQQKGLIARSLTPEWLQRFNPQLMVVNNRGIIERFDSKAEQASVSDLYVPTLAIAYGEILNTQSFDQLVSRFGVRDIVIKPDQGNPMRKVKCNLEDVNAAILEIHKIRDEKERSKSTLLLQPYMPAQRIADLPTLTQRDLDLFEAIDGACELRAYVTMTSKSVRTHIIGRDVRVFEVDSKVDEWISLRQEAIDENIKLIAQKCASNIFNLVNPNGVYFAVDLFFNDGWKVREINVKDARMPKQDESEVDMQAVADNISFMFIES